MKIRDARALPAVAQEDLRRKVVNIVLRGKDQVSAAKFFGITRQAVGKWMRAYRRGGAKALRAKERGRPEGVILLPRQQDRIIKVIDRQLPDQVKLPFFLWTRHAVAQLIRRMCHIQLSIWTVGRYLADWGFTPQKPARRAYEQNPVAVRRWLREEYPAIQRLTKREKAEIYWEDEMGIRSDHAQGRSYGRRGKTPIIPVSGQRFGCNMLSAITNRGRLNFLIFKGKFKTAVYIDFLKRLVRQAKRRVFLIADGHPVHHAKRVEAWIKEHADTIRVFFLPPYSPELNPDEMLNQDVKSNAVGRQRARNQPELVAKVRNYLRSRQRQPQRVKKYFQAKNVRYAAS